MRRGGRVAEGTALEKRQGTTIPSWVQIPLSPPTEKEGNKQSNSSH